MVRMSRFAAICLVIAFWISIPSISQAEEPQSPQQNIVFREPFTLKLPIDKNHYYEEQYERKIPYVFNNDVYLFNREKFGIKVTISGNEISEISYEKDLKKADVTFDFKQEVDREGSLMTLLIIESKLSRRLYLDALMTRPDSKQIFKTSILPVQPKLMHFESWPHPIVQLVLRYFRFSEKAQ